MEKDGEKIGGMGRGGRGGRGRRVRGMCWAIYYASARRRVPENCGHLRADSEARHLES